MSCSDYLNALSDYRDGRIADRRAVRRFHVHLRHCGRCRRHLKVLEEGLGALQHLDEVAPSRRFREELRHRLTNEISLGDPVHPTNAGLAAAFLLAAGVGLFVYEAVASDAKTDIAAAPATMADRAEMPGLLEAPAARYDLTLPPFSHSTLQFHAGHAPLGTFTTLSD